MGEVNATTAVETPKKKRVKKVVAKKAVKKTVKETTARRGRTSAYAGKHIQKLVDDPGLRALSRMSDSWGTIKNGISFETYRAKNPNGPGLARKHLADFILAGKVKVVK